MMKSDLRLSRSAFTLLEVLISLALVTTLMALAWSLFSTFSRLELRGRRTVDGLEITRTFQRQLQDDLDRVACFSRSRPSGNRVTRSGLELDGLLSGNEAISSGSPNSVDRVMSFETEAQFPADELESALLAPNDFSERSLDEANLNQGLVSSFDYSNGVLFEGSSDSLSFLIAPRDGGVGKNEAPGWQVVSYEWQTRETEGPDLAANIESEDFDESLAFEGADESSSSKLTERPGLYRGNQVFVRRVRSLAKFQQDGLLTGGDNTEAGLEGFETINIGRQVVDNELQDAEKNEVIDALPEIEKISFRYFDGDAWRSSWFASNGDLPVAVEVVFKVKREPGPQTSGNPSDILENEFEFEELEIGDSNVEPFATDSESVPDALLDRNPAFESDSIRLSDSVRLLIRIGTETMDSPRTTELGARETDSPLFSDFESESSR